MERPDTEVTIQARNNANRASSTPALATRNPLRVADRVSRTGSLRAAALLGATILAALPLPAAAIEEPAYEVVQSTGAMELRRYPAYHVVATPAGTDFDAAGNAGFRTLFRYISGANAGAQDIAMTAPVIQAWDDAHWSLAFVVPAGYAPDAIPAPTTPGVTIEVVPGGLYAATRFSGRWSEERFREQETALQNEIGAAGLTICGPTRYARYDPPFKPPFLRRNEVLIPVADRACPAAASG